MITNTKGVSKGLGPQERLLLTSLAGEGKRIFRVDEALPYWSSKQQAISALARLAKKGWLERLERGLYMIVPLEAGPTGQWTDDPLVIATHLQPDGAVAYWSALHYWNLTEQVPRTVFIQSLRQRNPSQTTILGVAYKFVRIKKDRFFGIVSRSSEGQRIKITDREKSLIDACDRPDLCGGILQVAQAFQTGEPMDWDRMDSYLKKMGSGAIYKRLGYMIETLEISMPNREDRLRNWRKSMSQGIALLDLGGLQTGSVKTKWRVRVNVPAWSEA
jgi:predicted transcriptional regulator of viral defense system